jgi:hypothetical protein
MVTQVEHVGQSNGTKKKKNQEEVQNIETDEEDNASEENGSGLLGGGDAGEKKGEGEATPLKYPPAKTITP